MITRNNNLQKIRVFKNYTQEDLAYMSYVSVRTIRELEHDGHAKLTIKIQIARALGFSVDQIWPMGTKK